MKKPHSTAVLFAISLLSGTVAWSSPFTQRHIVGGYCPYCAAAQNPDTVSGPADVTADPIFAPLVDATVAAVVKTTLDVGATASTRTNVTAVSEKSGIPVSQSVPASNSTPSSVLSNTENFVGPAPITETKPVRQAADGYWELGFDTLASFKFADPAPDAPATPGSVADIPSNVREFEGRHVRLSGYMLPLKIEGGLVTDFLVIRSPMVCCYGVVPAGNEWVVVKTKKGVPPMLDVPLVFQGTLHVGRIYDENMFAGLYRLDEEKVWMN